MEQEKGNYLTIIAVIVLVLAIVAGLWFFFFRSDEATGPQINDGNGAFQTVPRLAPERPRNLLQGYVSDTNLGAGEMTVSLAMDSMFVNATQPRLERTIRLTPDTRYATLDIVTGEETVGTIDDVRVWSDVTIIIAERAVEVYDRDFFTAREVVIMTGSPFLQ